jgi:hypothetical protein
MGSLPQALAIPSYFLASGEWERMRASGQVGLAIVNPDTGPGIKRDDRYARYVKQSQDAGVRVLGYVDTAYAQQSERPAAHVCADVDDYFTWYEVDGIFLDQVPFDGRYGPYYRAITRHVKNLDPTALTVINPGVFPDEEFMALADIVVTFENDYFNYEHLYPEEPAWVAGYSEDRFWHLIYGASSQAELSRALALSRARRAGWVYVTPYTTDPLDPQSGRLNPWAALPTEPYWIAQITGLSQVPAQ